MNAAFVLQDLKQRGLCIRAVGANLRLTPSRLATPEIITRVRQHKAELLAALGSKGAVPIEQIPAPNSSDFISNERVRLAGSRCEIEETEAANPDGPPEGHPAYSIIAMCQQHGVVLRIDEEGYLVIGTAGGKSTENSQPWPSLLGAIEAQLDAVILLVEMGWTLRAGFPMVRT